MSIEIVNTPINDLLLCIPKIHGDDRGWFVETWHHKNYIDLGLRNKFVQDNMSYSKLGTLRGLHMQTPLQGKLVQVIKGTIFDVAVDLRATSKTFGKWYGVLLLTVYLHISSYML